MKLVVDANVLFSALIRDSAARSLLFREELELYAPEYLLEEIAEHRKEILDKTGRSEAEFEAVLGILRARMTMVPASAFRRFMAKARKATPDKDDAAYLAAAFAVKAAAIWSNDKRLKRQSALQVFATHELAAFLASSK